MKPQEGLGNMVAVNLFEPYRIGKLELRNRFVRSATFDNTADVHGAVTDVSVDKYRQLGKGGSGLIVVGFAFVSPLGQAMPRQYGAHSDDTIRGLHRLVQAVHEGKGKIALQIVHAGIRSPYLNQAGVTAQAVSIKQEETIPHREMTDEEIEGIVSDFASAAARARQADFDAVQLHGAHGYLMSQFLSPVFNYRTDRWGGSLDNRRRFHLEVIKRVREAIGDEFPLMIKFGIQDNGVQGLTLSDGLETAQQMVEAGIDAIEVSWGCGQPPRKPSRDEPERPPFREWSAALKRAVIIPVMLVQGIRSLEMARNIVESGDADLISMARPFIREPDLIARWQKGETRPAECISCSRCVTPIDLDEPIRCRAKNLSTQAN